MTASAEAPHIGLVVEGPGDVRALPQLLRMWLNERNDFRDLLGKPVSCNGRSNALREYGVEGKVTTAVFRPGCVGVLVVLDDEGDAVGALGPDLLARVATLCNRPVIVALADSKYESWLVASAETLQLPSLRFTTSSDPVALIGAALPYKYTKPVWQPRLTARMDLPRASTRSRSLARMLAKFDELVGLVP